jgi:CheY-like chemotaxis protein
MGRGPILVIEDDHDARDSLRSLLEDFGYQVLTAADGLSAFELLRSGKPRPSMILLDLMMPIMDGWTFAEEIEARGEFSQIPIVIMSAFPEPTTPESAVAFCQKPLHISSLLKLIEQYC